MTKKVFISYRRQDSKWVARDLYKALCRVLPTEHVFMDIDSIPPGIDFVQFLDDWVKQCDVLLALIGPGWAGAADPKTGRRRLDNPNDFVRVEIRQALRRDIPVVPVLLDGAPMPDGAQLPEDLHSLARRNAAFIEHRTADHDTARLIRGLQLTDAPPPPSTTSPGLSTDRAPPPVLGAPVPKMVRIAAGECLMGSKPGAPGSIDNERPQHRVRIAAPFELGQFAVTFDEYDAFCEATGRSKPKDQGWGRGRRPVIHVSHDDAEAYCAWLNECAGPGWRLPTEAEWEYACRAGTTGPFGFDGSISWERVNYDANYTFEGSSKGRYRKKTVQVGTLPPNPWGLYEMHGNVWEWCADCWHQTYDNAPDDGTAWLKSEKADCSTAVVRGGSWLSEPDNVRSAIRGGFARGILLNYLGFRIARGGSA